MLRAVEPTQNPCQGQVGLCPYCQMTSLLCAEPDQGNLVACRMGFVTLPVVP